MRKEGMVKRKRIDGKQALRICRLGPTVAALALTFVAVRADVLTVRLPRFPVTYVERFTGIVTNVDSGSIALGRLGDTSLTFSLPVVERIEIGDKPRLDSLRLRPGFLGLAARVSYKPDRYSGVVLPRSERNPPAVDLSVPGDRDKMIALAGDDLRSASAMAFTGVGLSIAGGIVAALASAVSLSSPDRVAIVVMGVGLDVAGFICSLVAWERIGEAGAKLRRPENQQGH